MAFMVSFAARFYKIPTIHTFHIVTFYDQSQPAIRRKAELLLAKAARPGIITVPNAHDVAALKGAGLPQTVLLPNGVDLNFWQPDKHAPKNKKFTFLSAGRLEPQKGYEYLIKAVALLRDETMQPFQVLIAGEGKQKKQLQALADVYNVQDVVQFIGRKTPEEIRLLLSQADVAVFASLYETTPITLLEAWAVGVPVIMTRVGILRDVPRHTRLAHLVEPGSEDSLSAAMHLLMTDEARRSKVAATGHSHSKIYSWSGIAQIAEKLYGSVV